MNIDYQLMNRFFEGTTTPEETTLVLTAISANPEMEEYFITHKRLEYTNEMLEDYGSFIPASSMAADDGRNLCDFQCEAFILRQSGKDVSDEELAKDSRKNYWLRGQGTPLYNIGKLLESKGFLVARVYDSNMRTLAEKLKSHSVITVVNGDILTHREPDILSEDFSLDNNPNHAVVILNISDDNGTVSLFNPATESDVTDYPVDLFEDAWAESKHYMVTVREKRFPEEYIPQPMDLSEVNLNPELMELSEMIAENAHDIWGQLKKESYSSVLEKNPDFRIYAERVNGQEQEGHNHYYVPYSMLSEEDKEPDRKTAMGTIKLLKRLGYRLVNINSMYRCPDCGEVIEPSNNYCPNCGRTLTWKDFKRVGFGKT